MIEDEELKGKLINEAQTNWAKLDIYKRVCGSEFSYYDGFIDCGLLKEKRIAELEEKISVLLSCKNCPENKDGLICQKEYENKCLAQKIQFIKELQQENAELKGQVETSYEIYNDNLDYSYHIEEQLTKAKKVIEELYNIIPASMSDYAKEPMEHARKFMTEE